MLLKKDVYGTRNMELIFGINETHIAILVLFVTLSLKQKHIIKHFVQTNAKAPQEELLELI